MSKYLVKAEWLNCCIRQLGGKGGVSSGAISLKLSRLIFSFTALLYESKDSCNSPCVLVLQFLDVHLDEQAWIQMESSASLLEFLPTPHG